MGKELTTEQLQKILTTFLRARCEGIAPDKLNLRFCPTLESCDGASRCAVFRFHTSCMLYQDYSLYSIKTIRMK